jgi:hypothetical protein
MLKILRDSGKNEVARADYTASGLRAGLADVGQTDGAIFRAHERGWVAHRYDEGGRDGKGEHYVSLTADGHQAIEALGKAIADAERAAVEKAAEAAKPKAKAAPKPAKPASKPAAQRQPSGAKAAKASKPAAVAPAAKPAAKPTAAKPATAKPVRATVSKPAACKAK